MIKCNVGEKTKCGCYGCDKYFRVSDSEVMNYLSKLKNMSEEELEEVPNDEDCDILQSDLCELLIRKKHETIDYWETRNIRNKIIKDWFKKTTERHFA